MKIPTLLGLFILGVISAVVIILTVYIRENYQQPKLQIQPTNIEKNNLTRDSVTLTWQTSIPTTTDLLVASDRNMTKGLQNLKDNRDSSSDQARITHVVTVNNLSIYDQYFVKINIQKNSFPKAAIQISPLARNPTQFASYNPIVGSLVDSDLHPITDALVFLRIPEAGQLATGVSQNGNFILPVNLLAIDPNSSAKQIDAQSLANAKLLILRGNQKSEISLDITQESKPLPPIVLGRDYDFKESVNQPANQPASQSATPVSSESATPYNFDVNGDGRINNLDVTLILQNIGKKNPNLKTDINRDGVIDQKDLVLIKGAI